MKETLESNQRDDIKVSIANSWSKIAPFWPLKNLVAANPLAGFEDLRFEDALKQANAYFQQKALPEQMEQVNRETIKWLQAFFDEGQSTIQMPLQHLGLLKSTLKLLYFDNQLHKNDEQKQQWLKGLPKDPELLIVEILGSLGILTDDREQFLTLMLTTLPGWASHIKYRTDWVDTKNNQYPNPVTQSEYVALRLVFVRLIWPDAQQLLGWHTQALKSAEISATYQRISRAEEAYQKDIIKTLEGLDPNKQIKKVTAQFAFCIDVRCEPFRRALEAQGDYETFGCAGFFGVPVSVENAITKKSYSSCPALAKPVYTVVEQSGPAKQSCKDGYRSLQSITKAYQSLKYTFTASFILVEIIGLGSGLWMALKSMFPTRAQVLKFFAQKAIAPGCAENLAIENIPFQQQVSYGYDMLKMMGLLDNFSPLVVFCGHGSSTENNAYETALDCGACGGHAGGVNAQVMAQILNDEAVRNDLEKQNVSIPADTCFVAAEYNTTTDEVVFFDHSVPKSVAARIELLRDDLKNARNENSVWRCEKMGLALDAQKAVRQTALRSRDWAQVRAEWGLASNASFIIGPRKLTKQADFDGRVFLHSYEEDKDTDGKVLTAILTGPLVVAQWINAQYFFSSLDNVAFGAGSKITKNITGKVGTMQGNASDLMHGLPLQSVVSSDTDVYHEPVRLTVVVYAPRARIDTIIKESAVLQKLFGNGWVHLISRDLQASRMFRLQKNLAWSDVH